MIKTIRLPNFVIGGIGAVFWLLMVLFIWKPIDGGHQMQTITGDGKGYYAYLPAVFIRKDLNKPKADFRYLQNTEHGVLNKYSCGTALLMSPFFLSILTYNTIQGRQTDGYEYSYQQMANIAALTYFLLGLYALSQLMGALGFVDKTKTVVLLLLAFGTNCTVYVLNSPAFGHVYSFFAIAFFLLFTSRYFESFKSRHMYWSAFFLGLAILIRPFDALILLALPFLAKSWSGMVHLARKTIKKPHRLVLAATIAICVAGIQQLAWYVQTGNLVLYGYANEGFYFAAPALFETLFSFRKGWFLYTPLLGIALLGLFPLHKKNPYASFSYMFLFIPLVYLVSAWWIWYYGPSFGQRALINFYPFLILPLGYLSEAISKRRSKVGFTMAALAVVSLNLLQSYQYHTGILSTSDMNYAKYKYIFGKTGDAYRGVLGGQADIAPYHHKEYLHFSTQTDFDTANSKIQHTPVVWDEHRESYVLNFDGDEFNVGVKLQADAMANGKNGLVRIRFKYLEKEFTKSDNIPLVVVDLSDSTGVSYYYDANRIKDVPIFKPDMWHDIELSVSLPIRDSRDKLSVYIWNRSKIKFSIDDYSVEIFKYE